MITGLVTGSVMVMMAFTVFASIFYLLGVAGARNERTRTVELKEYLDAKLEPGAWMDSHRLMAATLEADTIPSRGLRRIA